MKKNPLEYLLLPFAGLYGLITLTRNALFDLKIIPSTEFRLPLICVGNLAVGGTGKTPHIEMLVEGLSKKYSLAVLSRGYKRKSKGFVLADENSDAGQIGDEPCQIKNKFPHIMVAVSEDRVKGIEKLLQLDPSPQVILLDDAFQHRRVKAGLSILLDEFSRPWANDYLMPAGRLREPVIGKKRAQLILISKTPEGIDQKVKAQRAKKLKALPGQQVFFTGMNADEPLPVFKTEASLPESKKTFVLLVSGIAKPGTISPMLPGHLEIADEMHFPDHHNYTREDIVKIVNAFHSIEQKEKIILTTGKDTMKFRSFEKEFSSVAGKFFYLPVRVSIQDNAEKAFFKIIQDYVESYS